MASECVFCNEIKGLRENNFSRIYPEYSSRFLHQTENLLAFPCIGQLVPGHFLIIPRKHQFTFAETFENISSFAEELDDILSCMHQLLGTSVDHSLFFEHGAYNSSTSGGCGIYHAHLHVLPDLGYINIKSELCTYASQESHAASSIVSALKTAGPSKNYAFIGAEGQGYILYELSKPLPSQTIRRLIGTKIGVDEWDWRKAGREFHLLNFLEPQKKGVFNNA